MFLDCSSRVCTLVQHSGKGHCGFLWEDPTLTFSKSETLEPINTKFCLVDYVGEISGCAKNITIGCTGRPHTYAKHDVFMYIFFVYLFILFVLIFFCALRLAHSTNGESHKGQWWLKRRVYRAGSAFWGPVDDLSLNGPKPPKPQNFDPQRDFQHKKNCE